MPPAGHPAAAPQAFAGPAMAPGAHVPQNTEKMAAPVAPHPGAPAAHMPNQPGGRPQPARPMGDIAQHTAPHGMSGPARQPEQGPRFAAQGGMAHTQAQASGTAPRLEPEAAVRGQSPQRLAAAAQHPQPAAHAAPPPAPHPQPAVHAAPPPAAHPQPAVRAAPPPAPHQQPGLHAAPPPAPHPQPAVHAAPPPAPHPQPAPHEAPHPPAPHPAPPPPPHEPPHPQPHAAPPAPPPPAHGPDKGADKGHKHGERGH
jgi:hypothetical protein